MSYTAIFLKVQFPTSSPIASKTFNLDSSLTVSKALSQIGQQSGFDVSSYGLFISSKGTWLDESKTLSDYSDILKNAETVELRERTSVGTNPIIWGIGVSVLAGAIAFAIYQYRNRK